MRRLKCPLWAATAIRSTRRAFAAEVLHERARDLFIGVHKVLVSQGLDRVPRAGVVLTGGASQLEGLEDVAETIFGHRVRLGCPAVPGRAGRTGVRTRSGLSPAG